MMSTVQRERATGQSAPFWLFENQQQVENTATGESIVYLLSGYPTLGNMIDYLSTDCWDLCTLNCYTGVTDPEAGLRMREPNVLTWSQNLSALGTIARQVIPGLRELTPSEQSGLSQYRKRLFRKL